MSRRKRSQRSTSKRRAKENARYENATAFQELVLWAIGDSGIFADHNFHGNIKWRPEQLAAQALVWSWQETKHVTDAFSHAQEVCGQLEMKEVSKSYTSMMNGLTRYYNVFSSCLGERFQTLAEDVGGELFRTAGWVPIGFDGSRATAPRSVSNERAFCARNYGQGNRAKYGKKKSKGFRRKRNQANPPHPQAPQVWLTMLWHMGLRLPWTWSLGPSNSSERDHVKEILREHEFPQNTLFCGDAGFTGYPLWHLILDSGADFLVRVGANVKLLSQQADFQKKGRGVVLCWPKGQMNSGQPPLRLRLVRVTVGKTKMWLLTSVQDRKKLSKKQMVRFYKMRWGIEVEFRGLKQTIDKQALRCRNADRLRVELDWSIRGMAFAELLALREQISSNNNTKDQAAYDPEDRSLAAAMRALRKCMRNLHCTSARANQVYEDLAQAMVQRYNNRTDKKARYRPKNPDKKPLGEPEVRPLNDLERQKLNDHPATTAA
jgi:hypothetical protein